MLAERPATMGGIDVLVIGPEVETRPRPPGARDQVRTGPEKPGGRRPSGTAPRRRTAGGPARRIRRTYPRNGPIV
ncbi:hypothetical protein ACIHAR_29860 [Streptomyces sp. NPDC052016]|uniref:hypothetical protein n=1 Tax=unclassified Streptomyces TaxID=2593676 RepID=UPI00341B737F